MNIYCVNCAEPWEMDSLHEEVTARWPDKPWEAGSNDSRARQKRYEKYYNQVKADFVARGCAAFESFGARCSPRVNESSKTRAAIASALYDLGDLDGAAAEMEDFDLMGMFD